MTGLLTTGLIALVVTIIGLIAIRETPSDSSKADGHNRRA